MFEPDLARYAVVAAIFVLAGFVKGAVGLGLPTVAMGLLSVTMPPAQAAALLVIPSVASNLWQAVARPGWAALARRLAPLLFGVCAGTALGTVVLGGLGAPGATVALGAALVVYAVLGLLSVSWRIAPQRESGLGALLGLITGVVTSATGVFAIPAVAYLQALGLEREDLVQALGLSFLVSTLALAASLGPSGVWDLSALLGSLFALVPVIAGMALGQWVRSRIAPALFARLFLGGLLALGLYLVWRGW
jgi:uncharacterized protein